MAVGDLLQRAFTAVGDLLGVVRPVDREGRPLAEQPAAIPSDLGPFTIDTMATLRRILAAHDEGDLMESGLLAQRLLADADVQGALLQRVRALQACPTRFHPADESEGAKASAEKLEAAWGRIVTPAALADLVCGAIFLGASCAQVVWYPDPDGVLEPRLEPWPWHALEYRRWERRWYAHTTRGPLPIDEASEQWVLFTPLSELIALAWGVVRCLGVWVLRADFGGADLSKHAEVHGSPAWVAMVPSSQREQADAKTFVGGLRRLGRNAVIPAPQGNDKASSYDVRLEQADTDASKVYELILRIAGGKVRLAILGQDLTSQNNKVGTNASSDSGEGVTDLVVVADARGVSLGPFAQLARAWARFHGVPAPRVTIDAERESDAKADAEASAAMADAIVAWADAGVEVDAIAHATAAGMKGATKRVQVRPPPAPPAAPASGGSARAAARGTRGTRSAPRAASDRPVEDDPEFPFLSYERKGNAGCEICGPLEGVLLPANHPFWDTHTPPMHAHCVCNLLPMDASYADAVTPEDELHALPQAAPGWGTGDAPPTETDE